MNQMMMQAMQALQQMQQKVGEAQEKLKTMSVTERGADGMVSVTVSGEMKVTALTIDPSLMSEPNNILEDILLTTVNRALAAAETMRERELGGAAEGMPNIPGLSGLFGA